MPMKARLILTALTAIGALLLGLVGGWLGPVLSWWWLLVVTGAFFVIAPWSPVVWSQEDIAEEMKAFLEASEELAKITPKIHEMAEELKEAKGLTLEQVQQLGADFEDAKALSPEAARTLRELLFPMRRRTFVVQLMLVFFIGAGGALLAHQFALWFLHR